MTGPAAQALPVPPAPARSGPAITPHGVAPGKRAEILGPGWRTSTDRAWLGSGDAEGFHLLVADAADGYTWRTLANLSEPGLDTDRWIGNTCVTGSGRHAVVVYAPRTFTNKSELFDRGGFTAVVDMATGAVHKLPVLSSLAYFNPACGPGDQVLLTQGGAEDLGRTRLIRLDAASASLGARIEVPGQLTSAVPTTRGIVAADRGALVRVDDSGTRRVLARTNGVPFKLAADAEGGVVFMERSGAGQAAVRRVTSPASLATPSAGTRPTPVTTTLATGPLTKLDVTSGHGGRVFVTGSATAKSVPAVTPRSVSVVSAPAGSRLSMQGTLAVTSVLRSAPPNQAMPGAAPNATTPVTIAAKSLTTGRKTTFSTVPADSAPDAQAPDSGQTLSPAVSARPGLAPAVAGDPHNPADFAQRYCSVPRDDPANQAMQPKPRQVEWAVDQAVRGVLTLTRPANWKNLHMPAYSPQGLFPPITLIGGGFVPAQVMLGVAAQESNLWEAARFAVPGVTANPLIGNYFGLDIFNSDPSDDWTIDWSQADCGYGVTQVTDGMRLAGREKPGETALPFQTQRAVALDFAANVAAGLRILQSKWNEVAAANLTLNNGDSSKIENWFYAVWAYNSGFHQDNGDGSPWGLGWANNPINPRYPANREPFLDSTAADAAHPQDWPYPEKVMGFAGHPVEVLESPNNLVAGFRPAWWNGDMTSGPLNRSAVKPPITLFCDASNQCEPGTSHTPNAPDVIGEPAGPCAHQNTAGQFDLHCWYHQSTTWKPDCDFSCGNELLRFDPGWVYQDDGTAYPPRCTLDGLPPTAQIIDDVPDGTESIRPDCPRPWSNAGTFTFTFAPDSTGQYPAKIDTHQIGAGFGGHFWFTHTRTADDEGGKLTVSATWKLNTTRDGPMRILVALPDHGAETNEASYTVTTANGDRTRIVHQPGDGNRWVSLGAFMFDNVPQVTLTSVTPDGDGSQDIAFDAMAFVPITGTYHEETLEADAVFDEDQNIDTSPTASWLSGPFAGRQDLYDWGMSKTNDILDMAPCQLEMVGDCLVPGIKTFAQNWQDQITAAGTDPVNHPDGLSIASWIGFANSYLDRPATDARPPQFDNDDHYKIRNKATVSFVTDSDGVIIPGSEWASYENRTANTHLPAFVRNLFSTLSTVYGVAPPDLRYQARDLHEHDGGWTSADPVATGILPGRAYAYAGKAPVLVDASGTPSDTNGVCVAALTVAGGSIGYRPMLGVTGPTNAMEQWVNDLHDNVLVPQPVADLAGDIQGMFFNDGLVPGVSASIFAQAPPIWQELDFKVCADGTIQKVSGRPLLRASWMPDQYLYHNGKAIDLNGNFSGSNLPVLKGNFDHFSAIPDLTTMNPYGACDFATDRSGNPWDITALPPQDANIDPPHAHFCVDKTIPIDAGFSS